DAPRTRGSRRIPMKLLVLTAIAGTTLVAGKALTTKYTIERALKVATESSVTMETTTMEMERDGEPAPNRGGGGGKTEMTREEVHVDRVLEAADGAAECAAAAAWAAARSRPAPIGRSRPSSRRSTRKSKA